MHSKYVFFNFGNFTVQLSVHLFFFPNTYAPKLNKLQYTVSLIIDCDIEDPITISPPLPTPPWNIELLIYLKLSNTYAALKRESLLLSTINYTNI